MLQMVAAAVLATVQKLVTVALEQQIADLVAAAVVTMTVEAATVAQAWLS
jgi:hypothetical protein